MKKIGIIANCDKPRAADVLSLLDEKAAAFNLELLADEATAQLLPSGRASELNELFDAVDAVMALGGDGTMLRVVRQLDGLDKPVVGVNIGGLGFLASVAEGELDLLLECLAGDNFDTAARTLVESVVIRDGEEMSRYHGLNEVLVSSGHSSRTVTLDVSINDEQVTSYVCDGLMVATPTGSTGHSLSAGAPILRPDTAAFVISLICPHALSSRPLVVPDTSQIAIVPTVSAGEMLLSVDGQVGVPLQPGDCVNVGRSERVVRLIHLPGYEYFAVLRNKLHWSGSSL